MNAIKAVRNALGIAALLFAGYVFLSSIFLSSIKDAARYIRISKM